MLCHFYKKNILCITHLHVHNLKWSYICFIYIAFQICLLLFKQKKRRIKDFFNQYHFKQKK